MVRYITLEEKQSSLDKNPFVGELENPSEKMQLTFIKKNGGEVVQYIKAPSTKVQLAAVKDTLYAIQFIRGPAEEVQMYVVKIDPYMIQSIYNPTEKVQLFAVKKDPWLIKVIRHPTKQVLKCQQ